MTTKKTLGIVGARGHTGAELIRLVDAHPGLELAFVSSRELAGQRLADHNDAYRGELRYENVSHEQVAAKGADVVVLARFTDSGEDDQDAEFLALAAMQKPLLEIVGLPAQDD